MEPLASAPREVLASVRGVAFDIDDTLTRNGVLEEVAFAALWSLRRAGVRLIAATGRPLGWVDVIARQWPVDAAVGENGLGWVWRDGSAVHEGYAASDAERAAQATLINRVKARVAREMPHVKVTADSRARRADTAFDIGETVHLAEDQICGILDLIRDEGAFATRSTVHAHAGPPGSDKATGIVGAARAALGVDLTGPDRGQWIFVGDSPNDEEAFGFFPNSVGVRNIEAHAAHLKHRPRWVTQADRGQGFAELAAAILAARNG